MEPLQLRPQGSCRLRVRCDLRVVYEPHQRHALSFGERFQGVRVLKSTCRAAAEPAPPPLTRSRPRSGAIGEIVSFTGIATGETAREGLRLVISIKNLDSPLVRTTTPAFEDIASAMGYVAHAPRRSASVAAPSSASARLRLVHDRVEHSRKASVAASLQEACGS
jgi:hypothetical protein